VAEPISNIMNCSLLTGKFPDQLKIAKVSHFYKSGEKDKFVYYRPISILPSFSKIFEKVVKLLISLILNYYYPIANLALEKIIQLRLYGFDLYV